MTAIFQIVAVNAKTGKETVIDFLGGGAGPFNVKAHSPTLPTFKGGGTFLNSALSEGSRPVSGEYANVEESFAMEASSSGGQVGIIDAISELEAMFKQAFAYNQPSTSPEDVGPVYIIRRSSEEQSKSYLPIVTGHVSRMGDYVNLPFEGEKSGMGRTMLGVEVTYTRLPVQDVPPETSTAIEISNLQPVIHTDTYQLSQSIQNIILSASLNPGTLPVGVTASGTPTLLGFRFNGIDIPQGTDHILDAYLEFTTSIISDKVTTIIKGEAADNASAFIADPADYDARVRTQSSTIYITDQFIESPPANTRLRDTFSIRDTIQEIAARPGWVDLNSMNIFMEPLVFIFDKLTFINPGSTFQLIIKWRDDTNIFGQPATSTEKVYVSNGLNDNYLSQYRIGAGGNLLGTLPHDLFSGSDDVNIGSEFEKFYNIILNIDNKGVVVPLRHNYSLRTRNSIPITPDFAINNTGGGEIKGIYFANNGVSNVSFSRLSSTWNTDLFSGVTAYWAQLLHESSPAASGAVSQQQTWRAYTVNKSWVDIAADQISGDLKSHLKMILGGESGTFALDAQYFNRAIIGSRSLVSDVTGDQFSNFINLTDFQNPPGIRIKLENGAAEVSAAFITTNSRYVEFTSTTTDMLTRVKVSVLGISFKSFLGKYRLYIRCQQINNDAADTTIRCRIESGTAGRDIICDPQPIKTTNPWQLVDLQASLDIPASRSLKDDTFDEYIINIEAKTETIGTIVRLFDIALMPKNSLEYAGDFQDTRNTTTSEVGYNTELTIDSSQTKFQAITQLVNVLTGEKSGAYQADSASGALSLNTEVDQRLYFLFARYFQVRGTHDAATSTTTLTDSTADFINNGVKKNQLVRNITDNSEGTITAVTATTVTVSLSGGTDNDWDNTDAYVIFTDNWVSEPWMLASITLKIVQRYFYSLGSR